MYHFVLRSCNYPQLKAKARKLFKAVSSSHLTEAVAQGLGFSTHAALLAAERNGQYTDKACPFMVTEFARAIEKFGYEPGAEYSNADWSWSAMLLWEFLTNEKLNKDRRENGENALRTGLAFESNSERTIVISEDRLLAGLAVFTGMTSQRISEDLRQLANNNLRTPMKIGLSFGVFSSFSKTPGFFSVEFSPMVMNVLIRPLQDSGDLGARQHWVKRNEL